MKILLAAINAKYIHSNPAVYSLKAYAERFLKEKGGHAACEDTAAKRRERNACFLRDRNRRIYN